MINFKLPTKIVNKITTFASYTSDILIKNIKITAVYNYTQWESEPSPGLGIILAAVRAQSLVVLIREMEDYTLSEVSLP
jgi:hypothetical protein